MSSPLALAMATFPRPAAKSVKGPGFRRGWLRGLRLVDLRWHFCVGNRPETRRHWLAYTFPQALPGNGVLSGYTRPSFLRWDLAQGKEVFGRDVAKLLADLADAVDLELQGFLARPLYVCTCTGESHSLMRTGSGRPAGDT